VANYKDKMAVKNDTIVSGCMQESWGYMEGSSYELPDADHSSKLSVAR
jgi:hypothetical protein